MRWPARGRVISAFGTGSGKSNDGIDIAAYRDDLMEIFPEGVCDYRLGDAAWPDDLLEPQRE